MGSEMCIRDSNWLLDRKPIAGRSHKRGQEGTPPGYTRVRPGKGVLRCETKRDRFRPNTRMPADAERRTGRGEVPDTDAALNGERGEVPKDGVIEEIHRSDWIEELHTMVSYETGVSVAAGPVPAAAANLNDVEPTRGVAGGGHWTRRRRARGRHGEAC